MATIDIDDLHVQQVLSPTAPRIHGFGIDAVCPHAGPILIFGPAHFASRAALPVWSSVRIPQNYAAERGCLVIVNRHNVGMLQQRGGTRLVQKACETTAIGDQSKWKYLQCHAAGQRKLLRFIHHRWESHPVIRCER